MKGISLVVDAPLLSIQPKYTKKSKVTKNIERLEKAAQSTSHWLSRYLLVVTKKPFKVLSEIRFYHNLIFDLVIIWFFLVLSWLFFFWGFIRIILFKVLLLFEFEFCNFHIFFTHFYFFSHNLSFWVLLIFVLWFLFQFEFLVFSQFEFCVVTFWVERSRLDLFCLSQQIFFGLMTIKEFKFCCYMSLSFVTFCFVKIWVLFLSFVAIWVFFSFVTTWVFEFDHIFLFVTTWYFSCHNFSF